MQFWPAAFRSALRPVIGCRRARPWRSSQVPAKSPYLGLRCGLHCPCRMWTPRAPSGSTGGNTARTGTQYSPARLVTASRRSGRSRRDRASCDVRGLVVVRPSTDCVGRTHRRLRPRRGPRPCNKRRTACWQVRSRRPHRPAGASPPPLSTTSSSITVVSSRSYCWRRRRRNAKCCLLSQWPG